MASVAGTAEAAGGSPKKVTVDLESEEVPGRGANWEEPTGTRRLSVFGGEGATVVATSADSARRAEKVNSESLKCDGMQCFCIAHSVRHTLESRDSRVTNITKSIPQALSHSLKSRKCYFNHSRKIEGDKTGPNWA